MNLCARIGDVETYLVARCQGFCSCSSTESSMERVSSSNQGQATLNFRAADAQDVEIAQKQHTLDEGKPSCLRWLGIRRTVQCNYENHMHTTVTSESLSRSSSQAAHWHASLRVHPPVPPSFPTNLPIPFVLSHRDLDRLRHWQLGPGVASRFKWRHRHGHGSSC